MLWEFLPILWKIQGSTTCQILNFKIMLMTENWLCVLNVTTTKFGKGFTEYLERIYPGYQRFFLARGRRKWRPKAAGTARDMTDTGNRARKTSGTQGIVSTKVVSQLHKIARAAKSRATMTIGIMGSNSLTLLGWGKRNAWIHSEYTVFVLLSSLTPQHLGLQSIKYKTIVTHKNFQHCCLHFYAFIRRPFSKQLYVQ